MEKKDRFLDLEGVVTQDPFRKSMLFSLIACVAAVLIGMALPLQQYGEKAGLALGFFIAIIILFASQSVSFMVAAMILAVGGFFLGFWDWPTFMGSTTSSVFLQMTCIMIVAAGVETTALGRRLSFWTLEKMGKKPVMLVFAFAVISAFLSSFISNAATLILLSSIANTMLLTMGEEPGKSKIGRCIMLLIPVMSFLGGMGLITGSPGSNVYGLGMLSTMSEGKYTVDFATFAKINYPIFLICIIPVVLVYISYFKLKNSDVEKILPPEYYHNLSKELGSVGGSEIRWLIIIVTMIAWLLAGGNGTVVPVTLATISLMPVIGTVPMNRVWNIVPMKLMFGIFMVSPIGLLFTTTGLSEFVQDMVYPLVSNFSPLVLMIILCLLQCFLTNLLVNVGGSVTFPVLIGVAVPVCESLGYNPAVVLLPTIVTACFWWMLTINSTTMLTHEYGWWEPKDSVVPGGISLVLVSIIIPVLTYILAPLAGMPIYL